MGFIPAIEKLKNSRIYSLFFKEDPESTLCVKLSFLRDWMAKDFEQSILCFGYFQELR